MIGPHRRPRRPSRRLEERGSAMHKVAVVVVVLVLSAGVGAQQGWIPDLGRDDTSSPPPTEPGEPPPSGPGLDLAEPVAAPLVLDPAPTNATIRRAAVAAVLDGVVTDKGLGRHLGLDVVPLGGRGRGSVYGVDGDGVVTPASTLKLLTTLAALHVLGPDHRFSTRLVAGPGRHSIVLVGGGDPLLTGSTPTPAEAAATYPARASLQDLARRTASRLTSRGVRSVTLAYDLSLYAGPAVNPRWESSYVPDDVVSPIMPLWVDEGREVDGNSARSADPAAEAASRFATFLTRAGVKVTAPITERTARPAAREIASVQSAPLAQIVQHVLEESDNEGAETLLRQLAIGAGKPGSFVAGVDVLRRELADLGVTNGVRGGRLTIFDGSGLSRDDEIPIATLTSILQTAAAAGNTDLRPVISTLPVAGFTGSLAYRFVDDAPAGLGFVRAKTGTLTAAGVHGLAGIVVTRRGTPLLFAAVADQVPLPKTLDARAQLDLIAAALATCAC